MIYLDSASTSLYKPPQVAAAVLEAVSSCGNPGRGAHKHAMDAAKCIYQGRKTVASFFGATPEQVVFTSSATESLNIAIFGLLKPTDHVITTVYEHNSVLRPLYFMESRGMELSFAQNDFESCIKPNTKAVVITAASNVTGQVIDLQKVSGFCKAHGLLLIVDAAQAAGLIPLDMKDIDVLCFTGHKSLLGPQGVGGLVTKVEIQPHKFGGSGFDSFSKTQPCKLPESLEAGTLNTPGIAGLSAGIDYVSKNGTKIAFDLAKLFHNQIKCIGNVKVYSNLELPIVALNIGDLNSGNVEFFLSNEFGISVRGGFHCAPLLHKIMGTSEQGMVRFSFSPFNTEDDVQKATQAIKSIAER